MDFVNYFFNLVLVCKDTDEGIEDPGQEASF